MEEKKPPQATEGGQCAIGMQPPSLVTLATHTDIATSPPAHHHHIITSSHHHRAITLQGMEAYTMQAKRGAGSRHTSRNIGGGVSHPTKEKKPPQATEGGQCAIRMQAATPMSDRVVTSYTHTDIDTSPPAHRAIALQGMEALERGRGAAALDNSLAPVTPIPTSTHHHPDTSSNRPARYGSFGAGQGCSRPHSGTSHTHTDIDTSPPRHIEQSPCKVWKQWSGAGCSRPHSGTSGHTYRPPAHHPTELPPRAATGIDVLFACKVNKH